MPLHIRQIPPPDSTRRSRPRFQLCLQPKPYAASVDDRCSPGPTRSGERTSSPRPTITAWSEPDPPKLHRERYPPRTSPRSHLFCGSPRWPILPPLVLAFGALRSFPWLVVRRAGVTQRREGSGVHCEVPRPIRTSPPQFCVVGVSTWVDGPVVVSGSFFLPGSPRAWVRAACAYAEEAEYGGLSVAA